MTTGDIDDIPLPGMPEPQYAVAKYAAEIPVSDTLQVSSLLPKFDLAAHVDRVMNATPEQRRQWDAERKVQEAADRQARAEQRESTATVPLTVDTLAERMGWTREYAEHLVQPYCDCEEESYGGGWSYCQHARDLGLAP